MDGPLTAALWWMLLIGAAAHGLAPPPVGNVRVEVRTRRLTWDVAAGHNVTVLRCSKDGFSALARENRFCEFPTLHACAAPSTLTLLYDVGGDVTQATSILFPDPADAAAAEAVNVTCRVRDVDVLSCAWTPDAADLHFRMSWADTSDPDPRRWLEEEECAEYVLSEAGGQRVGCQVRGAGLLPSRVSLTVSAQRGGATVGCTHLNLDLAAIEELEAPKVSVRCNASLAVLTWSLSSLFHGRFLYELRLRKGSASSFITEQVTEQGEAQRGRWKNKTNVFELHNPGTFSVQIRVKPRFRGSFSRWSSLQTFTCDPQEDKDSHAWPTALLVALGTIVTLLVTILLCRRFSVLERLFPPIPQVKDPLGVETQDRELTSLDVSEECCVEARVQVDDEP